MKTIHSEMTALELRELQSEAMLFAHDHSESEDQHDYCAILDVHNNAYDFVTAAEDAHDSMCAVVFFARDLRTDTYCANVTAFCDSYVSAVRSLAEQLVIDYEA